MLASNYSTEEVIRANLLNFNEEQLKFVEKLEKLEDTYKEIIKKNDRITTDILDVKEEYEYQADVLRDMLNEVVQKVDELLTKKQHTKKDLRSIIALIDYSCLD